MEQKERFMPVHIIAAAGIVKNDKNEILMVKTHGDNWVFPGGQVEVGENVIDGVKREIMEETGIEVEVGELFSISSNTCTYPGYNGVNFICTAKAGEPRPSEENSESKFVSEKQVLGMMESQAYIERFKNYLEYTGRPIYMEYVSKPKFEMKVKRMI